MSISLVHNNYMHVASLPNAKVHIVRSALMGSNMQLQRPIEAETDYILLSFPQQWPPMLRLAFDALKH